MWNRACRFSKCFGHLDCDHTERGWSKSLRYYLGDIEYWNLSSATADPGEVFVHLAVRTGRLIGIYAGFFHIVVQSLPCGWLEVSFKNSRNDVDSSPI